jgi:hypothetical protein
MRHWASAHPSNVARGLEHDAEHAAHKAEGGITNADHKLNNVMNRRAAPPRAGGPVGKPAGFWEPIKGEPIRHERREAGPEAAPKFDSAHVAMPPVVGGGGHKVRRDAQGRQFDSAHVPGGGGGGGEKGEGGKPQGARNYPREAGGDVLVGPPRQNVRGGEGEKRG